MWIFSRQLFDNFSATNILPHEKNFYSYSYSTAPSPLQPPFSPKMINSFQQIDIELYYMNKMEKGKL